MATLGERGFTKIWIMKEWTDFDKHVEFELNSK